MVAISSHSLPVPIFQQSPVEVQAFACGPMWQHALSSAKVYTSRQQLIMIRKLPGEYEHLANYLYPENREHVQIEKVSWDYCAFWQL